MAAAKKGGSAPKVDYVRLVADRVIEQLQAGTAPWIKPWAAGEYSSPRNPTTDKPYRGGNAMWLAMQGRADPRWMTYKQAEAVGAQVRKGEKGTLVQYWMWRDERPVVDERGAAVLGADGKALKASVELQRPKVFSSHVWNAEQIDGLPPLVARAPRAEFERHERAEQMLAASPVSIRHIEGDSAHYSLTRDEIVLPMRDQFRSGDAYYATALHEVGHSTGHPSRLNRDLGHPFGSIGYAKEELRAEIASLMLGEHLGIGHDPGQHASYIQSWIRVLQDDPKEIFRAATDAEKIMGLMIGLERGQAVTNEIGRAEPGAALELAASQAAAPSVILVEGLDLDGAELAQAQDIARQARVADWFSDFSDDVEVRRRADERQSAILANEGEFASRSHKHAAVMSAVVDVIDGHRRGPWYVTLDERDVDAAPLVQSWLDAPQLARQAPQPQQEEVKQVQQQISAQRVNLHVPYAAKDAAKALGARWDKDGKTWYAPRGVDLAPLAQWAQAKSPAEIALDAQEQFTAAIRAADLILEDRAEMDGEWHRVAVKGDKGEERSGSYRGYLEGVIPGGIIRNFRDDAKNANWKFDQPVPTLTREEREKLAVETAERKAARAADTLARHEAVAAAIVETLDQLATAPADHPYLDRKDVPAYGVKVMAGAPLSLPPGASEEEQMQFGRSGDLIVPIHDVDGKVWSAQAISPDGRKSMAKGGALAGNFHMLGDIEAGRAWMVVEGWATGADVHRETGMPVAVAFMANNLAAVAKILAERYPEHDRYIGGDNDHIKEAKGERNVGKEKAQEAAAEVEAYPLIPQFEAGVRGSDWNDLKMVRGPDELAAQLQRGFAIARRRDLTAEIREEREAAALEAELEQEQEEERIREQEREARQLDRSADLPPRAERAPEIGMSR